MHIEHRNLKTARVHQQNTHFYLIQFYFLLHNLSARSSCHNYWSVNFDCSLATVCVWPHRYISCWLVKEHNVASTTTIVRCESKFWISSHCQESRMRYISSLDFISDTCTFILPGPLRHMFCLFLCPSLARSFSLFLLNAVF